MAVPSLRGFAVLSIVAAVATIGIKGTAYYLTGSVGLLSDALESLINLVAAVTAYFSLWYASRPVDATHTYGHEKIEFFSSGLEGILIIFAGGGIIFAAIHRLIHPTMLQSLELGTLLGLGAAIVNFLVARILIDQGRKHQSIVLEADGKHLMTDVWTSVAVLVGVGLVRITGIEALDPIVAVMMGLNIMAMGYRLVQRSFNGLMDHALPEVEQETIRAAIRGQLPEGTNFHALRTRQAGARRFVDFHLLVPGNLTVKQAHDLADVVETAIRREIPHLEVTIHIEPIEAKEAWTDHALIGIEPDPPQA